MHQQYHNKTNSSLNKAYFLVACIHLNWGHSQRMWTQDWKTTTKAIIKIDNLFKVISHFSQIIIQTIQLFYSLFWVFMLPLYSKQIVWCHHLCNISKFTINLPMKNIHFDDCIACMKKKTETTYLGTFSFLKKFANRPLCHWNFQKWLLLGLLLNVAHDVSLSFS